MKKLKVIANTSSGREDASAKVLRLVELASEDGSFSLEIMFTQKSGDAVRYAQKDSGEDIIVSIGGDGTLNEVVNGIYKSDNKNRPLAILPSGTVNDFATYLQLPTDVDEFYEMLKEEHVEYVDLGIAADRAFINVAAGGMLTEIAYKVEDDSKAVLGRFAYYIEGFKEFIGTLRGNTKLINLKIESEELNTECEALLFIIANSSSVGGFKNLMPYAEIHDGYMDVIILKSVELSQAVEILRRFNRADHTTHDKIIYLKTKEITISSDSDVIVDLDGEEGGKLPITFKVLPNILPIVLKNKGGF